MRCASWGQQKRLAWSLMTMNHSRLTNGSIDLRRSTYYMIVRALERGVREKKLARAQCRREIIRQRRHLLSGISTDVAELLKDKPVGHYAFRKLRKIKPIRQLEIAELMVSANNYTINYANARLATTKPSDLHKPDELKKATGLSAEQMSRLEREMASVSDDYKELEASYGDDMLVLVVATGFLERLLSKPEIELFLTSVNAGANMRQGTS
jgi:hypothetical protein